MITLYGAEVLVIFSSLSNVLQLIGFGKESVQSWYGSVCFTWGAAHR